MALVFGTTGNDVIDDTFVDINGNSVSDDDDTVFGDPGNDFIQGFGGNDTIDGGADNDTLAGHAGDDNLFGGTGNDILFGGAGNDDLNGGDGTDTANYTGSNAAVSVSLFTGIGIGGDAQGDTYIAVENVIGSGTGADFLGGDDGANKLEGLGGGDVLRGGGGADELIGGLGNDTADYSTAPAGVTVSLLFGMGLAGEALGDTLSGIENLIGSAFADVLSGDGGVNRLEGRDGDDFLNGSDSGIDRLFGGPRNDTYLVNSDDLVDESGRDGIDTIRALASFDLSTSPVIVGGDVENLVLVALLGDLNGTGNALANVITGNEGNNVLIGLAGNDTLIGAAGNDTLNGGSGADILAGGMEDDKYVVDDMVDAVNEAENQGTDTVEALINHTLAVNVENLILAGAANLNGTGNQLANLIAGNAGANTLDGAAGADILRGLGGNDSYVVDNVGDVVDETVAGSGGIDSVFASASFVLGQGVENLTLTGATAISGTGNALANTIAGNGAANILTGAAGADSFLFGTKLDKKTNVDTIADFSHADDTILLDNAIFTKLKKEGVLKGKFFHEGKKAHDGNDRIIHNEKNGKLTFDNNGDHKGGAVKFAFLPEGLDLSKGDFLVI